MMGNRHFKLGAWLSGMVAGFAMVMVLLGGTASAGEGFATLAGLPAQALSPSEMAVVEGKAILDRGMYLCLSGLTCPGWANGHRSALLTGPWGIGNPIAFGGAAASGLFGLGQQAGFGGPGFQSILTRGICGRACF
jgi:hypothetical protein